MITSNNDEFGYNDSPSPKVITVYILDCGTEILTTMRKPSPGGLAAYEKRGYKFYEKQIDLRPEDNLERKYESLESLYIESLLKIQGLEDQIYELKKKAWTDLDSTDVREIR